MSDYYSYENTILIAASRARGDKLSRLYAICESQKTISTLKLSREIDLVLEDEKLDAIYLKNIADKIAKLQAENAELRKQSEWISVDDELPELEERVLLKTQSGEIVTGWLRKLTQDDTYFCFGNEFSGWDYEFNYDLGAVTHFMPLPTPPKGE